MSRWLLLLLSLVGGAAAALAAVMFGTAALAGLLWIYVFGDNPWPGWVDPALGTLIVLGGLCLWALFARLIWLRLMRI